VKTLSPNKITFQGTGVQDFKIWIWVGGHNSAQNSMSLGNYKLKKQWDTTTHLLEWPESGTLTTPSADQAVELQELSFTGGKNMNGTATLQNRLVVFYKT